ERRRGRTGVVDQGAARGTGRGDVECRGPVVEGHLAPLPVHAVLRLEAAVGFNREPVELHRAVEDLRDRALPLALDLAHVRNRRGWPRFHGGASADQEADQQHPHCEVDRRTAESSWSVHRPYLLVRGQGSLAMSSPPPVTGRLPPSRISRPSSGPADGVAMGPWSHGPQANYVGRNGGMNGR